MDWKTGALNTLRIQVVLMGAIGGVWGGILHEGAVLLQFSVNLGGLLPMTAGALLGLGLGAVITPIDEVINGRPRGALLCCGLGGLAGMVAGGAGFQALYLVSSGGVPMPPVATGPPALLVSWVFFPLLMGVLGGLFGWISMLVSGKRGTPVSRAWIGMACGTAMAYPLTLIHIHLNDPWLHLAGLSLWGAVLALGLYWLEQRFAIRWLRLLTGPGEDRIFPLKGGLITLGKSEKNDIPLLKFNEIYPFHCKLQWKNDQYLIGDTDQGGMVWVNYRESVDHALKPGDIVKIGTALLQYGEAR